MTQAAARNLVTKCLYDVIFRHENLKNTLSQKASQHPQSGFIQALCYETLRHYGSLQAVWENHVQKKPKDKLIQILLTQALCERIILKKPDHAVVNETLKTLKKLKKTWAKSLINAVLRSCFKSNLNTDSLTNELNHPDWWKNKIKQDWPEQAGLIFTANSTKPPLWLRASPRLQSIPDSWAQHPYIHSAYVAPASQASDIPDFSQGHVSIQDASAQLAAHILNPSPEDMILDACAAPGGKTGHLLELCSEVHLDALEKFSNRAKRITENLDRINKHANVIVADAKDVSSWFQGKDYDKILLDVPCSASGILRRQPDIKFHRNSEQMNEICMEQEQLLQNISSVLKVNGKLLYVTCSLFSEENQEQIQRFLNANKNFSEIPLEYPFALKCSHGIQILPGSENMDGFYYCLLTRTQ